MEKKTIQTISIVYVGNHISKEDAKNIAKIVASKIDADFSDEIKMETQSFTIDFKEKEEEKVKKEIVGAIRYVFFKYKNEFENKDYVSLRTKLIEGYKNDELLRKAFSIINNYANENGNNSLKEINAFFERNLVIFIKLLTKAFE